MFGFKENILLILCILYLLFVNQYVFVDSFHCEEFTAVLVDDKKNFAERSLINDFDNLEVLKTGRSLLIIPSNQLCLRAFHALFFLL
jgi:hypothetical protein